MFMSKSTTPTSKPSIFSWMVSSLMLWAILILQGLDYVKSFLFPLLRYFFAARLPEVIRTPNDRFDNLPEYNYKANYVELQMGGGVKLPRMHYIDEGHDPSNHESQDVILCLHGEPTWSYLYRKMIPGFLRANYRVIVPDFIGFGKSDKYTSMTNYTHDLHTSSLRMLLDHLGIHKNVTLVCQDWGGLTGLSVVKDIPDTFSSLVIMNTGLPIGDINDDLGNPKDRDDFMVSIHKAIPFVLWRSAAQLLGQNIPFRLLFTYGNGFTKDATRGYTAPFPEAKYAAGAAKWPLLVPMYKDDSVAPHMIAARNFLKNWKKPALVMFGDSDPITSGQSKLFTNLIKDAKKIDIPGASHFLQETHGELLTDNIVKFKQGNL